MNPIFSLDLIVSLFPLLLLPFPLFLNDFNERLKFYKSAL